MQSFPHWGQFCRPLGSGEDLVELLLSDPVIYEHKVSINSKEPNYKVTLYNATWLSHYYKIATET